jgi:hypothetical protein
MICLIVFCGCRIADDFREWMRLSFIINDGKGVTKFNSYDFIVGEEGLNGYKA